MSYFDNVRELLQQPVLHYIFVGFSWLLVAAMALVLVIICVQFVATVGKAKRTGQPRRNYIPESVALLAVVAGFWWLSRWLLS